MARKFRKICRFFGTWLYAFFVDVGNRGETERHPPDLQLVLWHHLHDPHFHAVKQGACDPEQAEEG